MGQHRRARRVGPIILSRVRRHEAEQRQQYELSRVFTSEGPISQPATPSWAREIEAEPDRKTRRELAQQAINEINAGLSDPTRRQHNAWDSSAPDYADWQLGR